jgi:hypothetical protein
MSGQPLAILRIYLHRRRNKHRPGFLGRIFPTSLTHHLAEEALRAGIPFASVTQGNVGYVRGARRVARSGAEVEPDALPSCVELVGPKADLLAFVRAHERDLDDATLVVLEGIEVSVETHHHAAAPAR